MKANGPRRSSRTAAEAIGNSCAQTNFATRSIGRYRIGEYQRRAVRASDSGLRSDPFFAVGSVLLVERLAVLNLGRQFLVALSKCGGLCALGG